MLLLFIGILAYCNLGIAFPHVCNQVEPAPHLPELVTSWNNQVPISPSMWTNCTPENDDFTQRAVGQFRLLARGAWRWYLAMDQAEEQRVKDAAIATHRFWFGNPSRVEDRFRLWNRIFIEQVYKNAVDGQNDNRGPDSAPLGFECAPTGEWRCYTQNMAAATPKDSRVIYLCPAFFDEDDLDWKVLHKTPEAYFAAGTIAHEITHSQRLIGVKEPKLGSGDNRTQMVPFSADKFQDDYTWKRCSKAARDDPLVAVGNAQNYAYYFQRAFYDYCQCSEYEGSREDRTEMKEEICGDFWRAVAAGEGCTIL